MGLSKEAILKQPLIGDVSATNGAKDAITTELPFTAHITIKGTSDILFHAWNCEAVEVKSAAKKGSAAKTSDDLETYIHRDETGRICLPSEYLRMAIAFAAKSIQDPRSPRKSAHDLFKAGIISLEPAVVLLNAKGETTKEWDFVHKCRVRIQQNSVTRCRPAFHKGWSATVSFMVLTPEYIESDTLHQMATQAGRLIGVGDFRPTYGRFQVINFATGLEPN
jgi:hypothetical protein